MVNGEMGKNMDVVDTPLPIVTFMKENLLMATDLGWENTLGLMEVCMKGSGGEIR
mgnify:CR=1 FL=1